MDNNDILRRIRYIFNLSDSKMINIFNEGSHTVSRTVISNWLKKEDHIDFQQMSDKELAMFLNGFINKNRGKREGPGFVPEDKLNNNIIFRKLRIALHFKDDEILDVLALSGMKISKHELSSFFRKPGHPKSRQCKDQILRNFLQGLQLKYRRDG